MGVKLHGVFVCRLRTREISWCLYGPVKTDVKTGMHASPLQQPVCFI